VALPELLTTRLRLRPRTMADLEANLAMDLDPEVQRYVFIQGAPDSAAQRDVLIRRIASGGPERGGLWVVEWREEPGFLGWCGVFPLEDSDLIELGYRYARSAWGQGVATEAAGAVLEHGFRTLGFDPIVAVTHPDNLASQRVLEKLGFRAEGLRFHYGLDLAFYTLSRADHVRSRSTEYPPSRPPG
jgi:[ribosomal protein S5]-alanine N-acetyltransferase